MRLGRRSAGGMSFLSMVVGARISVEVPSSAGNTESCGQRRCNPCASSTRIARRREDVVATALFHTCSHSASTRAAPSRRSGTAAKPRNGAPPELVADASAGGAVDCEIGVPAESCTTASALPDGLGWRRRRPPGTHPAHPQQRAAADGRRLLALREIRVFSRERKSTKVSSQKHRQAPSRYVHRSVP